MFVNFDNVFGNKSNLNTNIIPEVLIAYFNSIAPKGTHYIVESDGTFLLEPIIGTEELHIEGLLIENDSFLRMKLGDQYSQANIVKYAYNSQKELKLIPNSNGEISINGEKLPINLFAFNPKRTTSSKRAKRHFIIKPAPFPPPIKLVLSNEKYNRTVFIQRVPNDSLDKKVYETMSGESLGLRFILNETDGSLNLTFRTNLTNEKNVRGYVEVYSLCSSFLDNTIKFNGLALGELNFNESNTTFNIENLFFWEKVLCIEETLGVTFKPAKTPLSIDIIDTVEELYQTLINGVPIKCDLKIETFDSSEAPPVDTKEAKSFCLVFSSSSDYSLFKKKLVIPSIFGVFYCKVTCIEEIEGGYRVHLEDMSAEKTMKVSKLNFKDRSARNLINISDIELFKRLEIAKPVKEFLMNSRS